MIDGAAARKTGTVSEFGAKLDTAADFVFVVVCLMKLIPVLHIEFWMYIWIGIILIIKMINLASGILLQKEFVSVHSVMNKITGGVLFMLPFTVSVIDLRYSAAVVCSIATYAVIQEGHDTRTKNKAVLHR